MVGWYAAAEKLKGVLVFPAAALVSALYPTMCRLFETDREGYRRTAQTALETSTLAVVPVAIGAYLYADLGIELYSKQAFGPAADNLRMLAPFIFMVYISMPLGACILAAGGQRIWTGVQALCIVVSLVLDPLLIPWFQQRTGNGGLGVCAVVVLAELMMVVAGVVLMPKGVFDRQLLLGFGRLFVAGGAMLGVGHLLANVSPFIAAPVAALIYLGTLRAIGGLKADPAPAVQGHRRAQGQPQHRTPAHRNLMSTKRAEPRSSPNDERARFAAPSMCTRACLCGDNRNARAYARGSSTPLCVALELTAHYKSMP